MAAKDPKLKSEFSIVKKLYEALKDGKPARTVEVTDDEMPTLRDLHLLTSKPVLYVCNVSEAEFLDGKSAMADKVAERAKAENNLSLVICSQMEAEIAQLEPAERGEFLASMGIKEPGLNRLIREAYRLLNLITYFTAGEKEVRAWTVPLGSKAPQAAGVIHTDFERGFIRAETYHCEDLFNLKTETAVKEAGKYRSEGKEYLVKDGDIMLFRFNV
jgi:GTP-binding protein YchF